MVNKIQIEKANDNSWIDKVNEFITAVIKNGIFNSCLNKNERLVIMVETYIIGEFYRTDDNKIDFQFINGCEWISNNKEINKFSISEIAKNYKLANLYKTYVPKAIEEINIGDWVETCHMLPGIVTEIEYNDNGYPEEICAWIPGYHNAEEIGGVHSVHDCGVHRIDGAYARILLSIGNDKLKELYHIWANNFDKDNPVEWSDYVTDYYNKNIKK